MLSKRQRVFPIIIACFGPRVPSGFRFWAIFLTCWATFCALGLGYLQGDWAKKPRALVPKVRSSLQNLVLGGKRSQLDPGPCSTRGLRSRLTLGAFPTHTSPVPDTPCPCSQPTLGLLPTRVTDSTVIRVSPGNPTASHNGLSQPFSGLLGLVSTHTAPCIVRRGPVRLHLGYLLLCGENIAISWSVAQFPGFLSARSAGENIAISWSVAQFPGFLSARSAGENIAISWSVAQFPGLSARSAGQNIAISWSVAQFPGLSARSAGQNIVISWSVAQFPGFLSARSAGENIAISWSVAQFPVLQ